ncbi:MULTISPECIES: ABC transporter ATP-binding protein [Mesorhizobium]|uniref:Sulfonate ABC transporter ATP-binding protein n=4 Tax=Mesorhizobium TaxID=68287 RepID=A0A1A5IER5_RHILI|nr:MULTISPECIES: ABC transporter ATP-binding protein [Mesorhizobium]ETA71624.1 ABC-type nitrate/sulfonate/bicarbonate transport system, ATPase component [Mesorhizobium japonicum R7A]MBE1708462.1 ABC transporter ATP-binding protein [Mesorhizobium japonicum]MBE1713631.1 ABC transporter ATP-binding protein [Mesorhizobium japonicum]MUT19781.1 ATP-binding cassette domain-containing protein [Mesorhizobium japonicum]MUT25751.1 ATP-binding cassette domain-containing protein [Mesorhizobium japonicum]
MTVPKLRIAGLDKSFGTGERRTEVLRDINLDLADNEFVSLVGTSGCGKSTLLSIVAGLQDFDAGELSIDGAPILQPGLDRGVVFQSYTLLPWLTARQNIEFALKAAGYDRTACREIALEHLDLVKLSQSADRFPSELSGGMKQRVAIARALSYRPKMLLMDEPFGALDALTRHQMQELLTQIWEEHRLTVLFVTHDVEEAVYLSDRIVVMGIGPGRIMQTFNVDIERPRREEVMETPAFMDLQRGVHKAIREASRRPEMV